MKRILFILLALSFVCLHSQTFQEITNLASYYGRSFQDFESENNLKPTGTEIKFGIESRAYNFDNYSLLVSEEEDNDLIGKIVLLGKKDFQYEETWYNIVKYANDLKDCQYIDGFYGDEEEGIYKYKISLNDMLPLLRNNKDLSNAVYYLVYKYKSVYYQIAIAKNGFLIRFQKYYKLKESK